MITGRRSINVKAINASIKNTHRTVVTAAPSAPAVPVKQLPEWLSSMTKENRQAYFEAHPNSVYNPNRKSKSMVPDKPSSNVKKGPAAPSSSLKENSPQVQAKISKVIESNANIKQALEPGSEHRVKVAKSIKDMKKDLKEYKKQNPAEYKKVAKQVKTLLKSQKPGAGYRIGSAVGNFLVGNVVGLSMAATGLPIFGAGIAAGAASSLLAAPLLATGATLVVGGAVLETVYSIKAIRRLFGYGGKFDSYNETETREIHKNLKLDPDKEIKSAAGPEDGIKDTDNFAAHIDGLSDDVIMSKMMDLLATGVAKGNVSNDVICKYGKIKKAA